MRNRPRLDGEWALFECALILLFVGVASAVSGCRIQALEHDRESSFFHACAGQAVDLATSAVALSQPGIREGNPVLDTGSDAGTIALMGGLKLAGLLVDRKYGDRSTDWALAVTGYGAGVWNVGVMIRR
jgi:hypothetical protein